MISVEEAAERILAPVRVLEAERRPPLDTLGQVLAEDVRAAFSIPPLDNTAMDGYAVRAADTAGARSDAPRFLRVVGELHAGRAPEVAVEPGTAVRIMTGAAMPPGADAVVQFELTTEASPGAAEPGRVGVLRPTRPGSNIRRAGEDVRAGEVVLAAGTEIRPAEVGVLASLGLTSVAVVRRPRVAVLSTGDELRAPGEALVPGTIYDANTYSVAALVRRYGGTATLLGIARDHQEDLVARIRAGLDADLLITSAGVSTGDYDLVKRVLAAEGEIDFWQVRMKPGRPLAFGQIQGVPVVGLPGNPVASMVAFEQFVRPAILKMLGKRRLRKPEVEARLVGSAGNSDGRRCFVRASVAREGDEYVATVTGPQGSGILTSMSQANGLVLIPEEVAEVTTGDRVRVQMLDWPEVE
jgi:molybdopterin molybdotransferase